MKKSQQLIHASLILVNSLLWILISQLTRPSLDRHGDMVEVFSWGQHLMMGSFKHPPFMNWVNHLWFMLFPVHGITYFMLSYTNAAVGVLGILALARLFAKQILGDQEKYSHVFFLLVITFTLLSGAYSNYAAKYNADTILISIWPWTAYTFFRFDHGPQKKFSRLIWTVIFSVLASISILAKYYSIVLLASLFVISLISKESRYRYLTIYPYLSFILILLMISPHLWWLYQMDFPFMDYLAKKLDSPIRLSYMISFPLSGIYQLPLSWLAFIIILVAHHQQKDAPQSFMVSIPSPLFWLSILPCSFTLLAHVFLQIRLSTHWAIPIWFALPIIMSCLLLRKTIGQLGAEFILGLIKIFWVLIAVAGVGWTLYISFNGIPRYTVALREMSEAVLTEFRKKFRNEELSWASGMWPRSAALSFYLPHHPVTMPGYPNEKPALVNPYPDWKKTYGAIICHNKEFGSPVSDNSTCIKETTSWLKRNGLSIKRQNITYRPEGFFYIKKPLKAITVFWVEPVDNYIGKD